MTKTDAAHKTRVDLTKPRNRDRTPIGDPAVPSDGAIVPPRQKLAALSSGVTVLGGHWADRNVMDSRLLCKIPTETEDWMAKALVENIKKGLEREPSLFDQSAAPMES